MKYRTNKRLPKPHYTMIDKAFRVTSCGCRIEIGRNDLLDFLEGVILHGYKTLFDQLIELPLGNISSLCDTVRLRQERQHDNLCGTIAGHGLTQLNVVIAVARKRRAVTLSLEFATCFIAQPVRDDALTASLSKQ